MDAQQIRKAYLEYFNKLDHKTIARAQLVPQNDPTTLFTGSGMQPLIPYLLGETHPEGTRLVNSQTCLRAQDIDEVGDNRHTTFFEMLGNWSLGDYFKAEQIKWIFEFLTDIVGLDANKLYVTCFIGDEKAGIPKDTEAADIWQKLFDSKQISSKIVDIDTENDGYERGINPGERIFYYDGSKNWWNRGKTGPESTAIGDPCGPDSEMFYDFGTKHDTKWGKNCHPNCDCGRFMEIGNNVFMAYRKVAENKFEPLEKPNIDHGSGLERIAAAAIDSPDAFKISLLWPIIEKLQNLSSKNYADNEVSMRIIADHLRAAVFLVVDGVFPSNKEQGYVLRRLTRRAIRHAFELGIEQNFLNELVPVITDIYSDDFPEMAESRQEVINTLAKEEKVFRQTLRKGVNELQKLASNGNINGGHIFILYDTYGFPAELSVEEATNQGYDISKEWQAEFDAKMQEQRERSQTASKGAFKGGLGGQTIEHKKYHTATHLLYQALRDVLGDHVIQNGSNITEERLRFDFSHPQKVTPEQIIQIEDIVNKQISNDLKISFQEFPTKVAIDEKGALGQFGDRYGEIVKVYKMIADGAEKPYSFEICGGPHVENTLQLTNGNKSFKIIKEESSSAGIRRIKAVLI